jgi:ABC-type phosphate transport system permease subunit
MSTSAFQLRSRFRALTDHTVTVLAIVATILVIAPLAVIFAELIYKGISSLNWDFFTKVPAPEGETGGGMANAIIGSAVLLGLSSVIGIPIGIGSGVYLAEFGRGTKLANTVRFTADVLNGVPSIVMGVTAYALIVAIKYSFHLSNFFFIALAGLVYVIANLVFIGILILSVRYLLGSAKSFLWRIRVVVSMIVAGAAGILSLGLLVLRLPGPLAFSLVKSAIDIVQDDRGYSLSFGGHFSAFSGGVALGIMMIPTVCRSTEEMLLMVPHAVREAALGLGVPNWRSVLSITVKTASPGIITGCMLAFARVAGETAPLLFTALGNQFWSTSLNEPIAALPLQIFIYASSPYEDQRRMAWAGALVLIVLIVLAVSLVRWVTSRGVLKGNS